jgi:hypothetical protein
MKNDPIVHIWRKVTGAEAELVALCNEHAVLDRVVFIGRAIGEPAARGSG